jgi:hypothetical protein
MSKQDPTIRSLLGELETPAPPPALRRLALQAAAEALSREPVPDLWTRLWESRGLRLVWAACVIVLIAGHVLISLPPVTPAEVIPVPVTSPLVAAADPELFDEIGELPRLQLTAQPLIGGGRS